LSRWQETSHEDKVNFEGKESSPKKKFKADQKREKEISGEGLSKPPSTGQVSFTSSQNNQ